jgi:hypothetical protein
MKLENIILSEVRFRRIKVACFLSYVEDIPKYKYKYKSRLPFQSSDCFSLSLSLKIPKWDY